MPTLQPRPHVDPAPLEVVRQRTVEVHASPARQLLATEHERGHRLPPDLRSAWSFRLSHPLDDVRVHDDPRTGERVRATGATAASHGPDLFFAPGAYDPSTTAGRTLLGHELAHAIGSRQSHEATLGGTDRSARDEHRADRVGAELSGDSGPVSVPAATQAEPSLLGDKSISFSGARITVSDTYVVRGPAVSDDAVTRVREALDEYYNSRTFTYRGYDVSFRLSVRRERPTTRTIGIVDWESTDWKVDSDTMMMTIESGTGRAGGVVEISVYDTSSKAVIAHEIGHYLSDRVGYFSEGYSESLLSRLGVTEAQTELDPEAVAPDGTVDIMGSLAGEVSTFSLSGILDEAIDDHEQELEDQAREELLRREL